MSTSGRLQFDAPAVEELQPNFTQFEIHKCVAVGGMGAVYRATQVSVDRPVAFKILPPRLALDEKFRTRFATEARVMAKLSHPNIVQLYDFGENGGFVWMAQEWIEGRTVEDVLRGEGALDSMEAAAMVAQACEGLGYAHKQGIVHRDVKPANLMENHEGIVKVMDFGLARAHRDKKDQLRKEGEGRYATAEYAAPELFDLEREPDHRVDIFALGILLFEALSGERSGNAFRKPSEVKPGLDVRFDKIVIQALQRNPEDRYQSCAELMEALREVVTTPAAPLAKKLATGPTIPMAQPSLGAVPDGVKGGSGGKGWIGLVAAGVVVLLGVGGWLMASKGGKEDPGDTPKLVTDSGEGAKSKKANPEEEAKAVAERERAAKERRARMEAMKSQTDPVEPEPKVVEEEMDEGVDAALARMDEELEEALSDAVTAFRETWIREEAAYVVACDKKFSEAKTAGDLDLVLFWMAEGEEVMVSGEPPRDDEGIPVDALKMREDWRGVIDPLKEPLEEAWSAFLQECDDLKAGLDEDDEEGLGLLERRKELIPDLVHFVSFCSADDLLYGERGKVARKQGEVTARVKDAEGIFHEKMKILERRGDKRGVDALLKAFGRLLVSEEKGLVVKGEIANAVAVRAVKDEMLAKLEELAGGGSKPEVVEGARSVALVSKGEVSEYCEWDKKQWKRRGSALENVKEKVRLRSTLEIGPGDFAVKYRLKMERIGATWMWMDIGETGIVLDGENGIIHLNRGGAVMKDVAGKNLGSLVRAGELFDCVVDRQGGVLRVLINGQEGLVTEIHDREMGAVTFSSGTTEVQLEEFVLEGTLVERLNHEVLMKKDLPRNHCGRMQLLPTEDGGLLSLVVEWGGSQGDVRDLWARRSRDGGEKWEDPEPVVPVNDLDGQSVHSFAAASNVERDKIWLIYAVGDANHKIFVKQGRSGGKTWSRSDEITEIAKGQGWNVTLAAQGVVLERYEKKAGRILVPMLAGGGADRGVYLLVSESGREWKRVGPVIERGDWGVEIMEDEQGKIWVSTGTKNDGVRAALRRWVVSEDGGETWSDPQSSTLPDLGRSQGCLALGQDGSGKPVWYYVNVNGDGGPKSGSPQYTNLTIYGSRDGGRMWKELRRFHYGKGDFPSLVELGPGKVGILYRRELKDWGSLQGRYMELSDVWGEK